MSALPPKADIGERNWDVRFVPKADIRVALNYFRVCVLVRHALRLSSTNPTERAEVRCSGRFSTVRTRS